MSAPTFLPWAIAVLSLAYAATVQLTHGRCDCSSNNADAEAVVALHESVSTIRDTP